MLRFLVHRGGNRPEEVNRLVQDDRTELELDPGCAGCVQEQNRRRERLLKREASPLPQNISRLLRPAQSSLLPHLSLHKTDLPVKCLQDVLSRGFTWVSTTIPSETPLSASPKITLVLCPGQCR